MDLNLKLIVLLLVLAKYFSIMESSEMGAKYLQDTIKDLKLKTKSILPTQKQNNPLSPISIRRAHTSQDQHTDNIESIENGAEDKADAKVPQLHLTKAELAALYENALHKGETVKLDAGDESVNHIITSAVHEIDNDGSTKKGSKHPENDGYYYYYYPLKSFVDELSSSVGQGHGQTTGYKQENFKLQPYYKYPSYHHHQQTHNKEPYIHSHTHQYLHSQPQHNVHIDPVKPNKMDDETDKKKGLLEPLFMAISGFIGMTVMFILSVLVLPKFNILKPKGFKDDEDLLNIGMVALHAIEGYDCTERFACEAGKIGNVLNLYDNRFVRMLRRFGPVSLGKQIDKIGKYTEKRYKCATIRCKRKVGKVTPTKQLA